MLRRQLLAPEEEEADVERPRGSREIAHELERDRNPALHVARAEPVHGAVCDPAWEVLLGRHRVVVTGEDDEGRSVRGARA